MNENMASARPYLLRALHEWMSDSGQTPQVIVDASCEGVVVPTEFVEDNHIVLNMSWSATRGLRMDNDFISFETRFSGTPFAVSVPVSAIKGIYARESGQGMMFQDEPATDAEGTVQSAGNDQAGKAKEKAEGKPSRPGLRVVK